MRKGHVWPLRALWLFLSVLRALRSAFWPAGQNPRDAALSVPLLDPDLHRTGPGTGSGRCKTEAKRGTERARRPARGSHKGLLARYAGIACQRLPARQKGPLERPATSFATQLSPLPLSDPDWHPFRARNGVGKGAKRKPKGVTERARRRAGTAPTAHVEPTSLLGGVNSTFLPRRQTQTSLLRALGPFWR